jgi:hypothetical protein
MDKLLEHPGFRLIYIDDAGSMSLITPSEHKEAILEDGYRCISHLWGNAIRWEDHPIKDVSWGVDVREEKRDKLLQIFMHFKGYFWMDVFCTNQDINKPLNIMGDIYKNCKECVCMLDIKIPVLPDQPCEPWMDLRNKLREHMNDLTECKWGKRVWTLQEWLLPPEIFYTEETLDKLLMMDPNTLTHMVRTLGSIQRDSDYTAREVISFGHNRKIITNIEVHLVGSGRECKNPEDYYYGIAGLFDIPLPDGLTFLEAEEEFASQFNARNGSYTIGKFQGKPHRVYEQWIPNVFANYSIDGESLCLTVNDFSSHLLPIYVSPPPGRMFTYSTMDVFR